MNPIRLGISTCPNDTFVFHAIIERKIDPGELEFSIDLLDVEELNLGFLSGRFDVAKVSFAAALAADPANTIVLRAGSALGFGVGPVLLARSNGRPLDREAIVLTPGEHTTAHLLYELFHRGEGRVRPVVFSAIMPALVRDEADFGVCIHEGRFTYQEHGLRLVEDLGQTWEQATAMPLPLGGIVARRELGGARIAAVQRLIRESIDYAHAHREEAAATMRRHAQEHDDRVLFAHVDLYVNAWTRDLGDDGERALVELAERSGRPNRLAVAD